MSTYRIVLMEPDVIVEPDQVVSITSHHVMADTFVEAYAAAEQLAADKNRVIQQITLTHPRIEINDTELRDRLLGHLDAEESYDEETIGWFNGYADATFTATPELANQIRRLVRENINCEVWYDNQERCCQNHGYAFPATQRVCNGVENSLYDILGNIGEDLGPTKTP